MRSIGVDVMRGVNALTIWFSVSAPIVISIKELINVAEFAVVADEIECILGTADVSDRAFVWFCHFGVGETDATNWADELWLSFLINSHEARNTTLGDSFVDDASLIEAALRTGIWTIFDHNASRGGFEQIGVGNLEAGKRRVVNLVAFGVVVGKV